MKHRKIFISLAVVLGIAAIISLVSYNFRSVANSQKADLTKFRYDLPADLNFAGEEIPVADFDTRMMFDSILHSYTYNVAHSTELHARAKQWFPVIEPILKRYKIPSDFKYVALIESGFIIGTSPKGAEGYWQFMEPTAASLGLVVNGEIDERYDIEKSTIAACRFLNQGYKELKSWTLTAAGYNMGVPGLQRRMKAQKTESYYDMLLNKETASYVFRVLAAKTVIESPEKYGYKLSRKNYYPRLNLRSLKIDSTITNLGAFAAANGTSAEILKILNPWLVGNSLSNPDKRKYSIQLPKDSVVNINYLASVMGFQLAVTSDSTNQTGKPDSSSALSK